jgi:hypothetical protein
MSYKKIISFSLYGDKKIYLNGAIENAKLQPKIYPDWICRFYCDVTVPKETKEILKDLGAEVFEMTSDFSDYDQRKMFWRFFVNDDIEVERYIIRDCDSRLNLRESQAVKEWIESGKKFHMMRDHIRHGIFILGGMWGSTRGTIRDMTSKCKDWMQNHSGDNDQVFLNSIILPLVLQDHICHASYYLFTGKELPFSVNIGEGLFVGQQYREDNTPIYLKGFHD